MQVSPSKCLLAKMLRTLSFRNMLCCALICLCLVNSSTQEDVQVDNQKLMKAIENLIDSKLSNMCDKVGAMVNMLVDIRRKVDQIGTETQDLKLKQEQTMSELQDLKGNITENGKLLQEQTMSELQDLKGSMLILMFEDRHALKDKLVSVEDMTSCDLLEYSFGLFKKTIDDNTQLIFNPSEKYLRDGQDAPLHCGVIGWYQSCQWEHGGDIYQLSDVRNGSYSSITASPRSIYNQCGIIIASVSSSHGGVWTCKVITSVQTLTAPKVLTIVQSVECPEGFIMSNGSKQCFKIFRDRKYNWREAKNKCEKEGLVTAKPSDAVAVALRKDLLDTYGDGYVWLDARGDGTKFMWQHSMIELRSDNPLWWPGYPGSVTTSNCLTMGISGKYWTSHPEYPYWDRCCSNTQYALCELIM